MNSRVMRWLNKVLTVNSTARVSNRVQKRVCPLCVGDAESEAIGPFDFVQQGSAYEDASEVDLAGHLAAPAGDRWRRRQLLGQSQDYEKAYGGIEFTPGVLLIGPKPGDPWYTVSPPLTPF
eukprot:1030708-Prorocentrum_minimum.AAC.1